MARPRRLDPRNLIIAALLGWLLACGSEPAAERDAGTIDASTLSDPGATSDAGHLADPGEDVRSTTEPDSTGTAQADPGTQDPGPPDAGAPDPGPPDEGPLSPPSFEGSGFFRVAEAQGRWWLVTPEGEAFYSVGVNHVSPRGYDDKANGGNPYAEAVAELYVDHDEWARVAVERLRSWGFNTIGAWSDNDRLGPQMPYTAILGFSSASYKGPDMPDYWDPAFEEGAAAEAAKHVAPRRDDPLLIGWFTDNELRWGRDPLNSKTMLEIYLDMPHDAPGRAVAESYEGDDSGFTRALADRYFSVVTAAVRAEDPNHLILGARVVSVMTPLEVVEAAGPHVDVLSVNNYEFLPAFDTEVNRTSGPFLARDGWLELFSEASGRPVMITEFSYRARDAGLPNTWPPFYPTAADQEERADLFEQYVERCYAAPHIIGHHWFEYYDEPKGGRFDGENCNFGLVDNHDTPWAVLTTRMTEVHARAPHRER